MTSIISSLLLRSLLKELHANRRSCFPLKVTPGSARPGRSAVPALRLTCVFEAERTTASASRTARAVSRSACEATPVSYVPPSVALSRIRRENEEACDARESSPAANSLSTGESTIACKVVIAPICTPRVSSEI